MYSKSQEEAKTYIFGGAYYILLLEFIFIISLNLEDIKMNLKVCQVNCPIYSMPNTH